MCSAAAALPPGIVSALVAASPAPGNNVVEAGSPEPEVSSGKKCYYDTCKGMLWRDVRCHST
jgi:hypothetical protein